MLGRYIVSTTAVAMVTLTTLSPADSQRGVIVVTAQAVANPKGDGPDGRGNTTDDTWGFWFELAHSKGKYARLDLHTATMSAAERKKGRRRKITGPIGSWLPNKNDTEGWIYHSDWDGRFEGVWGDKKANQVIMYPYVEKGSHGCVAITYKAPKAGKYKVTGKATDLQDHPKFKVHDGAVIIVEKATGGARGKELTRTKAFGDQDGKTKKRPVSVEFKVNQVTLKAGESIRVVAHPRKWWGSDMTKMELKIHYLGK